MKDNSYIIPSHKKLAASLPHQRDRNYLTSSRLIQVFTHIHSIYTYSAHTRTEWARLRAAGATEKKGGAKNTPDLSFRSCPSFVRSPSLSLSLFLSLLLLIAFSPVLTYTPAARDSFSRHDAICSRASERASETVKSISH